MTDLLRYRNLSGIVIMLFILGSACERKPLWQAERYAGEAFGTSYNIVSIIEDPMDLQKGIDSVILAVNSSMSTYLPDSDISRINSGDTTVIIDAMFRDVLSLSRQINAETKGSFDPTVGILVNAWGFGPGKSVRLDSAEVHRLKAFVGLDKIKVTDDFRIKKQAPEMQLDFNAIAKGYAIDRLALYLDQQGIENYLIEVGGEIVTKGENKVRDQQWVVGIDDPQVTEGRQLKITLHLKDEALASSGNYRKFRIDSLTGQKYVHTIDPKTGFTKNSSILAANVIAPNCALADGYATAFMVMDLEDSKTLLNRQTGLEAYLIYLDEKGDVKEFMTPGFKNKLRQ